MKEKITEIYSDVIAFFVVLVWVIYEHLKFAVLEPKSAFNEIKRLLRRK